MKSKSSTASREFDIQPHISMFQKVGQLNYRLEEAIGELVDNPIDAAAGDIVEVDVHYAADKIVIQDTAPGMKDLGLESALRLAQSGKSGNRLGGAGIGFKAALMSLGRTFSIVTAQSNDNLATQVVFNIDEVVAAGQWKLKSKKVDKPFAHGTQIEISQLNVSYSQNSERRLKERLSRIFKRFLKSGKLLLTVNGENIIAEEPNIDRSTRRQILLKVRGYVVKGWVAQQVNRRQTRSSYGFDLFRRHRVISAHDHVGLSKHPGICGVFVGEINLDCVPVVFNKNSFQRESPEWAEFEAKLKDFMMPLIRERQERYSPNLNNRKNNRATVVPIQRNNGHPPSSATNGHSSSTARTNGPVSGLAAEICSSLRELLGGLDLRHEFQRLGANQKSFAIVRSSANGGTITVRTNLDTPSYTACPLPDVWAAVHLIVGVRSLLEEMAGRTDLNDPVLEQLERSMGNSASAYATA